MLEWMYFFAGTVFGLAICFVALLIYINNKEDKYVKELLEFLDEEEDEDT
jgi:hypothetical protein